MCVCACVVCAYPCACVRPCVCVLAARNNRENRISPRSAPPAVLLWAVCLLCVCVCARECVGVRVKKNRKRRRVCRFERPDLRCTERNAVVVRFDFPLAPASSSAARKSQPARKGRAELYCVCVCVFIFSSLVCYSGEGKIQKGNTVPRGRARASFTNFLPRNHAKRQHQLPNVQSTANLNCCQVRVHSSTARDCSTNDGTSSNTTALSYQFASLRFFVPSSIDHSPSQSTQSKCRNQ